MNHNEIEHFLIKIARYDFETVQRVLPVLIDFGHKHFADNDLCRYESLVYFLDGDCFGEVGGEREFRRARKDDFFLRFDPKLGHAIWRFLGELKQVSAGRQIYQNELESALMYWDRIIHVPPGGDRPKK